MFMDPFIVSRPEHYFDAGIPQRARNGKQLSVYRFAPGGVFPYRLVKARLFILLRPVFLPDAQGPAAAFRGSEVLGALLVWDGKAEFHGVAVELVDAELFLALGKSFQHHVVDSLWLLGWVDGEFGFHERFAADGHGGHAVLGHSPGALEEGI